MQVADLPAVTFFGKSYHGAGLAGQYLNSLDKLILLVNFLETDDVVVLGESNEVVVVSFFTWKNGDNGDPMRFLVFHLTHRRPPSGIWTRVLSQPDSMYFRRLKSIAPPMLVLESARAFCRCPSLRSCRDGEELE